MTSCSPIQPGAHRILQALTRRRESGEGRADGLYAQAVDDPECHDEASDAMATPGGGYRCIDKNSP